MQYHRYQYYAEKSLLVFEFISDGPKGKIRKIVEYTPTANINIYNLGFGDYDESTDGINDQIVTNNGDGQKVLATVAATVHDVLQRYPKAWIFATGSTTARTRLYRMGIANNFAEISKDFLVLGYTNKRGWETFLMGRNYEAFLLTKIENQFYYDS